MIFYYANSFMSGIGKLGNRCCYSKKRSYNWKILNLIFFSIKKRYIANKIRLISTNIVVILLILLMVLLTMTNIMLQKYQLLIYKLYVNI